MPKILLSESKNVIDMGHYQVELQKSSLDPMTEEAKTPPAELRHSSFLRNSNSPKRSFANSQSPQRAVYQHMSAQVPESKHMRSFTQDQYASHLTDSRGMNIQEPHNIDLPMVVDRGVHTTMSQDKDRVAESRYVRYLEELDNRILQQYKQSVVH